jgi:parvulin-like peptidyl-prolyl isomerase
VKLFLALGAFLVIVPAAFAQMPATGRAPSTGPTTNPVSPPVDPDKVVLTIGTEKITARQFEDMINALPQQYQAMARGAQKRQFAEQVVQIRVLSQEAERRKLDQTPKVEEQLRFNRENILAGAMFQDLQDQAKVDDAAVQKYYDEHKSDYETVRASHILIRVKGAPMQAAPGKEELTDEQALAKAQDVEKKIAAGEDFATLAKANSDDTGSAAKGGDLGEFKKGMMVPPFEKAAFAAKVGEVTDPVKSPFGYHIIKVEAHTTKTLEEAKPEILQKLRPETARHEVEALEKGTSVQMDDAFFGPGAPKPPALGAAPAPAAAK